MQEWQACVSFEVNFDFCSHGDEIADWRNGRMRNCRSQVQSLRCLSMKAEHYCHPTRCIIYFVHLTNPTTLGQSTTCRKANWKGMIFYFTRRGASFHISSWPSVLSTCFMEKGYWPLWGRWYHSGAHRPLPLLSAWAQWKCLIAWFQKLKFPHLALIVNYGPIVQT